MAELTHSEKAQVTGTDTITMMKVFFRATQEDLIGEQLFVVCKADKDIGTVHGGIKELVTTQKEDQAGQRKKIRLGRRKR